MSTDTFEQDLAARMGAATDTIDAAGVTREGVDERLAARRATRRRRQGGIVLAAAALVVAAGIGAVVLGTGGEPRSTEITDEGGTTEVPTTEAPTTTECAVVTGPEGETVPAPILPTAVGEEGCPERHVVGETTVPATTTTPEAPTTTAPPTTTTPPATTAPATTTEPPTTTAPALTPGRPCTPGSSPDCIDPEGDGSYVYLVDGAQCIDQPTVDELCADLDGDGTAGYPHTIGPDEG